MNNNLILVTDLLVYQEFPNIFSLVPRQLNDFSQFRVHVYSSIALKCFLQRPGNLLRIKIISQSLNCGNAFPSISLLHSHMDF